MNIEVNANNILDTLINELDTIHLFHANVPKGAYIGETGEYRRLYNEKNEAEQKLNMASDLLSINLIALYQAVLTANRWYTKTQWQQCLSKETASKLLKCMIEQNNKDAKCERRGGNDYLLFMNKVISDWARKSKEQKTVA